MTRQSLVDDALRLAAARAPGRVHDRSWELSATEGLQWQVADRERRGPFMAELALYVPSYNLVKAWALREGLAPPSAWPAGWRPRFLDALAAGGVPALHVVDEEPLDTRPQRDGGPTPDARLALWLSRCPVAAVSPWQGRGGYRWLGPAECPTATAGRRLGRWRWQVGHGPGAVSGNADTFEAATQMAEKTLNEKEEA